MIDVNGININNHLLLVQPSMSGRKVGGIIINASVVQCCFGESVFSPFFGCCCDFLWHNWQYRIINGPLVSDGVGSLYTSSIEELKVILLSTDGQRVILGVDAQESLGYPNCSDYVFGEHSDIRSQMWRSR